MFRVRKLFLTCLAALPYGQALHAQDIVFPEPGSSSYVYVMSNDIHANAVAVLHRSFFGGLSMIGLANTGGTGVGVGTTAPPPDPLGAQNELLRSPDGRLLFAVNAGSNQVSVFRINGGHLSLVEVVPSGGIYPVSLALHDGRLYVLNSGGASNISVFGVSREGALIPERGATRLVGTDIPLAGNQPDVGKTPAEVQFSSDGKWLVVSVKGGTDIGFIETFAADRQGNLATDPVISPANDPAPFGFAFDDRGHLLVAEAGGSAVSSYDIGPSGNLEPISSSVKNGQVATCWLAAGRRYAFTANAGSDSLSAYRIDDRGELSLVQKYGVATKLSKGHAPTDTKLSTDGHSLFVLSPGTGSIVSFYALDTGRLIELSDTPVFAPLSGMQGLSVY
jgi:6-phosphogluconolactonase